MVSVPRAEGQAAIVGNQRVWYAETSGVLCRKRKNWAMSMDTPKAAPLMMASVLLLAAGCSGGNATTQPPADARAESPDEPSRQDGMTALEIVEKMLAVYREAEVYADNAEYAEHFEFAQDGVARQGLPMTVAVMLKRPDRFRLLRMRQRPDGTTAAAVVTCDGDKLRAQVSSFEPQLLELPAPDVLTPDSIAPDPLLREAMFPVPLQDVFPQLALLLAGEDQSPWVLEAKNRLVLLPPKKISPPGEDDVDCYRVQMPTSAGPQVCFIQKEKFLLRRIEIQNEELQKEMYPDHEFNSFRWQFDFYDIALDAQLPKQLFQLTPGEKAEVVDAFHAVEGKESSEGENDGVQSDSSAGGAGERPEAGQDATEAPEAESNDEEAAE